MIGTSNFMLFAISNGLTRGLEAGVAAAVETIAGEA